MKNIYTTEQLRNRYKPDLIWQQVDNAYKENYNQLIECLSHNESPLNQYSRDSQMSLLESPSTSTDELIKEIAETLKDAIYFFLLPKKERTRVTQVLKSFHLDVVSNQLKRINLFLDDSEMGQLNIDSTHQPKYKSIHTVFEILSAIQKDLSEELEYCQQQPRAGYLTSLQHTMGIFFYTLDSIQMSQKDQITLVQQIFDYFNVDWDEGDRENIKVSLQQPALDLYYRNQADLRRIPETLFSKNLSDDTLNDLIHHTTIMKRKLRRF